MTTWPTTVPFGVVDFSIEAHTRGLEHARQNAFAIGAGARWRGKLEVPALGLDAAFDFQGFLHSLRGAAFELAPFGGRTFSVPAVTQHTDSTAYSDSTSYDDLASGTVLSAAAARGAASITVTDYSTPLAVGDFVLLDGWLTQLISKSGSTFGIRPRARYDLPVGTFVQVYGVLGEFRLAGDVPELPIRHLQSAPITVEIEEDF